MRTSRNWTLGEIDFLLTSYGKLTTKEIAFKLNVNENRVLSKIQQLKLTSSNGHKIYATSRYHKLKKHVLEILKQKQFVLLDEFTRAYEKVKLRCRCGKVITCKLEQVVYGNTQSCGCIKGKSIRKGSEHVPGHYFTRIRNGASRRGFSFDITVEYIEELLVNQNFKCALSSLPIKMGYAGRDKLNELTASLDRIDSSKGYIRNNVQWVHKNINVMKNGFAQNVFITLCRKVVNRNKKSKSVNVDVFYPTKRKNENNSQLIF